MLLLTVFAAWIPRERFCKGVIFPGRLGYAKGVVVGLLKLSIVESAANPKGLTLIRMRKGNWNTLVQAFV